MAPSTAARRRAGQESPDPELTGGWNDEWDRWRKSMRLSQFRRDSTASTFSIDLALDQQEQEEQQQRMPEDLTAYHHFRALGSSASASASASGSRRTSVAQLQDGGRRGSLLANEGRRSSLVDPAAAAAGKRSSIVDGPIVLGGGGGGRRSSVASLKPGPRRRKSLQPPPSSSSSSSSFAIDAEEQQRQPIASTSDRDPEGDLLLSSASAAAGGGGLRPDSFLLLASSSSTTSSRRGSVASFSSARSGTGKRLSMMSTRSTGSEDEFFDYDDDEEGFGTPRPGEGEKGGSSEEEEEEKETSQAEHELVDERKRSLSPLPASAALPSRGAASPSPSPSPSLSAVLPSRAPSPIPPPLPPRIPTPLGLEKTEERRGSLGVPEGLLCAPTAAAGAAGAGTGVEELQVDEDEQVAAVPREPPGRRKSLEDRAQREKEEEQEQEALDRRTRELEREALERVQRRLAQEQEQDRLAVTAAAAGATAGAGAGGYLRPVSPASSGSGSSSLVVHEDDSHPSRPVTPDQPTPRPVQRITPTHTHYELEPPELEPEEVVVGQGALGVLESSPDADADVEGQDQEEEEEDRRASMSSTTPSVSSSASTTSSVLLEPTSTDNQPVKLDIMALILAEEEAAAADAAAKAAAKEKEREKKGGAFGGLWERRGSVKPVELGAGQGMERRGSLATLALSTPASPAGALTGSSISSITSSSATASAPKPSPLRNGATLVEERRGSGIVPLSLSSSATVPVSTGEKKWAPKPFALGAFSALRSQSLSGPSGGGAWSPAAGSDGGSAASGKGSPFFSHLYSSGTSSSTATAQTPPHSAPPTMTSMPSPSALLSPTRGGTGPVRRRSLGYQAPGSLDPTTAEPLSPAQQIRGLYSPSAGPQQGRSQSVSVGMVSELPGGRGASSLESTPTLKQQQQKASGLVVGGGAGLEVRVEDLDLDLDEQEVLGAGASGTFTSASAEQEKEKEKEPEGPSEEELFARAIREGLSIKGTDISLELDPKARVAQLGDTPSGYDYEIFGEERFRRESTVVPIIEYSLPSPAFSDVSEEVSSSEEDDDEQDEYSPPPPIVTIPGVQLDEFPLDELKIEQPQALTIRKNSIVSTVISNGVAHAEGTDPTQDGLGFGLLPPSALQQQQAGQKEGEDNPLWRSSIMTTLDKYINKMETFGSYSMAPSPTLSSHGGHGGSQGGTSPKPPTALYESPRSRKKGHSHREKGKKSGLAQSHTPTTDMSPALSPTPSAATSRGGGGGGTDSEQEQEVERKRKRVKKPFVGGGGLRKNNRVKGGASPRSSSAKVSFDDDGAFSPTASPAAPFSSRPVTPVQPSGGSPTTAFANFSFAPSPKPPQHRPPREQEEEDDVEENPSPVLSISSTVSFEGYSLNPSMSRSSSSSSFGANQPDMMPSIPLISIRNPTLERPPSFIEELAVRDKGLLDASFVKHPSGKRGGSKRDSTRAERARKENEKLALEEARVISSRIGSPAMPSSSSPVVVPASTTTARGGGGGGGPISFFSDVSSSPTGSRASGASSFQTPSSSEAFLTAAESGESLSHSPPPPPVPADKQQLSSSFSPVTPQLGSMLSPALQQQQQQASSRFSPATPQLSRFSPATPHLSTFEPATPFLTSPEPPQKSHFSPMTTRDPTPAGSPELELNSDLDVPAPVIRRRRSTKAGLGLDSPTESDGSRYSQYTEEQEDHQGGEFVPDEQAMDMYEDFRRASSFITVPSLHPTESNVGSSNPPSVLSGSAVGMRESSATWATMSEQEEEGAVDDEDDDEEEEEDEDLEAEKAALRAEYAAATALSTPDESNSSGGGGGGGGSSSDEMSGLAIFGGGSGGSGGSGSARGVRRKPVARLSVEEQQGLDIAEQAARAAVVKGRYGSNPPPPSAMEHLSEEHLSEELLLSPQLTDCSPISDVSEFRRAWEPREERGLGGERSGASTPHDSPMQHAWEPRDARVNPHDSPLHDLEDFLSTPPPMSLDSPRSIDHQVVMPNNESRRGSTPSASPEEGGGGGNKANKKSLGKLLVGFSEKLRGSVSTPALRSLSQDSMSGFSSSHEGGTPREKWMLPVDFKLEQNGWNGTRRILASRNPMEGEELFVSARHLDYEDLEEDEDEDRWEEEPPRPPSGGKPYHLLPPPNFNELYNNDSNDPHKRDSGPPLPALPSKSPMASPRFSVPLPAKEVPRSPGRRMWSSVANQGAASANVGAAMMRSSSWGSSLPPSPMVPDSPPPTAARGVKIDPRPSFPLMRLPPKAPSTALPPRKPSLRTRLGALPESPESAPPSPPPRERQPTLEDLKPLPFIEPKHSPELENDLQASSTLSKASAFVRASDSAIRAKFRDQLFAKRGY